MSIDFDKLTSGVAGAPATWGSQCCEVAMTASAEWAAAALPSSLPGSYTRYEVILGSETLPDNGERRLLWTDSIAAGHNLIEAHLRQLVGGALVWRFRVVHSGTPPVKTIYTDTTPLSFNTVNRLEFKWDKGAGEWEIRRDGATLFSGGMTDTPATSEMDSLNLGSTGPGDGNVTYYLDNIAVSDVGWIGAEGSPSPPGSFDVAAFGPANRCAIVTM